MELFINLLSIKTGLNTSMEAILDYCKRRWHVVLIVTALIIGNLYVWIPILSTTLSRNITEEVNPMLEIIKIFASGVVTLFAVWAGAWLSQRGQMKHFMVQHITETNALWKKNFKEDIANLVATLRDLYEKNLLSLLIKNTPTEDAEKYYEKTLLEIMSKSPIINEQSAKVRLSMDYLGNSLHKELLDSIYDTMKKCSFEKKDDYPVENNDSDLENIVNLSDDVIKEKDRETLEKIKRLL